MLLLLSTLALAASWQADTAAAVAGPDEPADRLGALQAALLTDADGDHRARLRDLLQALDRLAPLPAADRVAAAERILAGETVTLAAPPPPPPEPWAVALAQQLAVAPSTDTAELLLASTRRAQVDSVSATERLDAVEELVAALAPLDSARSAKARPLYEDALSPSAAARARAEDILHHTLAGELRLVQLGLRSGERVRADFEPTVVDGWWFACNTFDNESEWHWSDERPDEDACGEGGVAARKKGWTVAIGGEPVEREAELGALSTLGVRHGCRTDIVLRTEVSAVYGQRGAVPAATRVMGTGPGRPQDCRGREETEAKVAAAVRALEEATR